MDSINVARREATTRGQHHHQRQVHRPRMPDSRLNLWSAVTHVGDALEGGIRWRMECRRSAISRKVAFLTVPEPEARNRTRAFQEMPGFLVSNHSVGRQEVQD